MKKHHLATALAPLFVVASGSGAPAQAASIFGMMPASVVMASQIRSAPCRSPVNQALAASQPAQLVGTMSKASAILGGRVSQLELIRMQQSGGESTQLVALGSAPEAIVPGAGSVTTPGSIGCPQLALPSANAFARQLGAQTRSLNPEEFLASKRLTVQHTAFDADWDRVRNRALPRRMTAKLTRDSRGLSGAARLAAVNAWTHAHVRYSEDKALYGKADYWANASTTLRKGAGDCEDIAIVKMQMLAAMGVSRSDMYLTIARDLARNADHAMLVVKMGDRNWLLDNATDEVLDASLSYDYRPIFSYSGSQKWLHGY